GQTGSGKTYTMLGPEEENEENNKNMGLIPRCICYILSELNLRPNILSYTIQISFLEIYKEKLKDLLNPTNTNIKIKLKPNGNDTYISNLSKIQVYSLMDVLSLLEIATNHRTKAETNMNSTSSRSHMIMFFELII